MNLEREFAEVAQTIKYDIMKERIINYYNDLSQTRPSIFSAEDKYQNAIRNMTLEQLKNLAENAWQDELEKLNF